MNKEEKAKAIKIFCDNYKINLTEKEERTIVDVIDIYAEEITIPF